MGERIFMIGFTGLYSAREVDLEHHGKLLKPINAENSRDLGRKVLGVMGQSDILRITRRSSTNYSRPMRADELRSFYNGALEKAVEIVGKGQTTSIRNPAEDL